MISVIDFLRNRFISKKQHYELVVDAYKSSECRDACVIVIDSSNNANGLSIWKASRDDVTRLYVSPDNIGLDKWWQSCVSRCEQDAGTLSRESIAKLIKKGDSSKLTKDILREFVSFNGTTVSLTEDIEYWRPRAVKPENVAAASQEAYTIILDSILKQALELYPSRNLILVGAPGFNSKGVALKYFDYCWPATDESV